MASPLPLRPALFHKDHSLISAIPKSRAPCQSKVVNTKDQENHGPARTSISHGFQFPCCRSTIQTASQKLIPPGVLSSMGSAPESDHLITDDEPFVDRANNHEMEFTRVNCLVWVLHESARGFSLAIQALELARTGPELAMAWRGVDVHAWHKNMAYQVAVFALLKAAIEVDLFLCHKCSNNLSPVHEILSVKANLLGEHIERELNTRNPRLLHWFRTVELPRIAGLFIPLFQKWSMEYAGSGVAGIILAISCCAAIRKLDPGRICRPLFCISIEDALVKLMNLSHSLVSLDKLHHLASEAGFEEDFLLHFGRKVLPCKNTEDIEFWIGLVQKKLSAAFYRESVSTHRHMFHNKVQESSLATFGLFAYLGRETRLYLSGMGIKDLDKQTKDFLSYLECGSLVIYPELSTLSEYQLFMEVVTDEIGWLHFYPAVGFEWCQDRRRSRQRMIQAEKEIVLYKVLTACYDVISEFAHYSHSRKQPMDSNLLEFLLHCQSLLATCMEDYWAAYDEIGEPQHLVERSVSEPKYLMAEHSSKDWIKRGKDQYGPTVNNEAIGSAVENEITVGKSGSASPIKPSDENFLQKSSRKVISASANVWMGTQLLFIDIIDVVGLLKKQLRGCKMTEREKKKIKKTLVDFATLVPVIILMLLPVSAVGHAAMLAAIKKYMPCLIPSPYTSERLGLVKQIKRIKKMELQRRSSIQDASTRLVV
ncbi:uncharacterized protein [Coffea arabica]|uniref:Uncharacterized protein isoform X1 n=2 Tax=Coffea arabica TaxID=13443 RepID=A0ABM4U2F0_COFAR|nr:uncharacterized protein LOC113742201 isoform X1 [Coffea arabica]XP_027125767.1 uncharacterized protein LOC113742201 isoform X1 [Coffea arabica]